MVLLELTAAKRGMSIASGWSKSIRLAWASFTCSGEWGL